MKKIVKNYGNTLVIVFDKEDQNIYGIEEGDFVEISDLVVIKKRDLK